MSACRSCGRAIEWAKTPTGATIPLERVANVYTIGSDNVVEAIVSPSRGLYVSHFATCPDAKTWSGKSRAKGGSSGSDEGGSAKA